jgi:hypothetical protein
VNTPTPAQTKIQSTHIGEIWQYTPMQDAKAVPQAIKTKAKSNALPRHARKLAAALLVLP